MTIPPVGKRLPRFAVAYCTFLTLVLAADPALTIYNQNFAVIRETLPLDLKAGSNSVRFSGATAQVEPNSVILRDAKGARVLQVMEQNYRNDPVSQDLLLNLYEGKTIDFSIRNADGTYSIVPGKVVRSGYVNRYQAISRNGAQYQQNQMNMVQGGAGQPVIEVGGKLQFSLPGLPIFPALGDDTILKPSLDWTLYSAQPAKFDAELSYISGGLSWTGDYNIIAPESGDTMDLVGWVTLDNQSGKQFDHASVKLMAGDVNKVQQPAPLTFAAGSGGGVGGSVSPQVTEKAFEDYHLYSLPVPVTIHDRETKQVEFLRAAGIQSARLYVYDGARFDRTYGYQDVRQNQLYGTQSNPSVWIMREFANSEANHLGVPLPAGRVRFYRRDADGQVEFTGENDIKHTAKNETLRIYTGNAFDITGERRQTKYQAQFQPGGYADESFEIRLRNHKTESVTVRVVEHLYRWSNWVITQESSAHRQTDSKTIEFDVTLRPDEERTLTYTAHYTW